MKKHNQKFTAIFLTLAVIGSLLFSLFGLFNQPQKAKAAWYSDSWGYRQKIIIDHNKVPNTDQTDFPVLIKITDTNNPIFSSKVQDDGDDIRFTNNDETTLLNHEIESFSKSTHELWAWVKIPTLSHETDTIIYLYYGNQSAEAPTTASKQAVWSNGFSAVWHFGEDSYNGTADEVKDSTSSALFGYASGATTTGSAAIGKGAYLNNRFIKIEKAGLPVVTSASFGMWVKKQGVEYPYYGTSGVMNTASPYNTFDIYFMGNTSGGSLKTGLKNSEGASSGTDTNSRKDWNDKYHYVMVSWEGGNAPKTYVDGQLAGTGAALGGSIDLGGGMGVHKFGLGAEWWYGAGGYNGWNFNGYMDEPRLANVARSADWVATEYANQNSPETFAYIASEVTKTNYTVPTGPANWYDLSWGSRQPILLNNSHNKVPNTNQTDFPVLVKITDSNNNLWSKAQADGDDILFTSSDGTTKLAHEIEKYDAATHELWAWVKVPTLLTGTDTNIYMYYGNTNSPNQQSKTAVWSNGYVGAWHLEEQNDGSASGAAIFYDSGHSQLNASDYTAYTAKEGKVDGGIKIGSYNRIVIPTHSQDYNSQWSLGFWVKLDSSQASIPRPYYSGHFMIQLVGSTREVQVAYRNASAQIITLSSGAFLPSQTWSYLKITKANNSTDLMLNINGQSTIIPGYINPSVATSQSYIIGAQGNSDGRFYLNGNIDEINESSTARSADWIATEYNNQNSPETFMSFGAVETADSYAPSNPTTITSLNGSGGEPLGNAGTDPTPYYSWPEPEVAGGATDTGTDIPYVSGVAGYYSYFGTSCDVDGAGGADPTITRGLLSDTGGGLHYSSDTSIQVPDLATNQDRYCLRIRTRDIAGNISALSPTTEVAIYDYDTTSPNAPTFLSVNPAGYSSTDSFEFSWPAASDTAGDGISGIQGYQYMRGNGTDEWSAIQVSPKISGITHYNETGGENIFLVRSVDNAGNVSSEVQTTYYYSADPPAEPTNLTVTPTISDQNSFSFSWEPPSNPARPIVDYGYSINASPEFSEGSNNITWTGNANTSLSADHFASQQGINTFYLVARDDSGAYSLESASVAEVQFNCTTPAPSIPTSISLSDSSNRALGLWALTLKWNQGVNHNIATFDHYSIERSTDAPEAETGIPQTFTEIASTKSLAFIDATGLSNTQDYHYRVRAYDDAGSASAASEIVSKMPTGKYITPPALVSEPKAVTKATTATVSWVVDRSSSSAIRFGKSSSDLSRSQIDPVGKTSQSISLVGLEPATTYYYQVQSLDDFRDYTSESAYSSTQSFTTLSPPTISNVEVSNITLSSADISWETSSASNTKAYFGPTITYSSSLPEADDSMTTKHTVKLTPLAHTTKYHFKIQGSDIDGNPLSSDDYTFETLPLPTISSVDYQTDSSGPVQAMVISWVTNVPTSSSVEYTPRIPTDKLMFEESQSALVTKHKVSLLNLEDNTDYSFRVSGVDQFGNDATSDEHLLKTSLDTRPAKISGVTIETSNVGLDKQDKAQIAVSWKTDEPTTSMVEFSEGVAGEEYTNKTIEDRAFTTNHLVIIPELLPTTPYRIRIVSTDRGDNVSRSDGHTVIPGDVPRSALQIILQTFTRLFGWLGL